MHMRRKKWARPELESCPYYVDDATKIRGHWHDSFPKDQPLHIELGCGKGVSTAIMAHEHMENNYIAMDLSCDVLGVAHRNIEQQYAGDPIENILLFHGDVTRMDLFFAPQDLVERIYINFCNPWNKRAKQHKKRLTHTRQLMQYRTFLQDNGEIWFKTDDDMLFMGTLRYLKTAGFSVRYITYDMYKDGFAFGDNYVSEHEAVYTSKGVPIKFLIAVKDRLNTPLDLNDEDESESEDADE